jgi:RNA polymerase sigma-70 factor (ECF subfamily)
MEHRRGAADRASAGAQSRAAREAEGEEPQKAGFAEEALPHLESVYRFALRLTRGDTSEAEDLVQETYLRAYRSWETFTRGTQCRSWLFTICRNAAVRRGEGKASQLEHLATDLGVDDVTSLAHPVPEDGAGIWDPEAEFFASVVEKPVRAAREELPREYREAVVLCDIEGLGYGEIAERLGVAGGTIKSRIHRGRRLLQGSLHAYAVDVGHLRPAGAEAALASS